MYKYIGKQWNDPKNEDFKANQKERMVRWRRENSIQKVDHPTRLDRARALGYKAKQGVVIARTRIRRGSLKKHRIRAGRKPKRKGIKKITMAKSLKRMAEERTSKKFPNMEVLNSYFVGADGRHKYFEIILVDPHHPSVKADKDLNWISTGKHKNRALRGLTSAGKKGRGLRHKGIGAEKLRPSLRAHDKKGK